MTTTASTEAPGPIAAHQEWHKLTGDLDMCLRTASDLLSPVLDTMALAPDDRARLVAAIRDTLTVTYDQAFQHGRDSFGVLEPADRLWAVHHQGSDSIIAQPSRQAADDLVAALGAMDVAEAAAHQETAALHYAVVVEWPFTAAHHAEALAEQEREGHGV